jgi:hypothetical protein
MKRPWESKKTIDILKPEKAVGFIQAVKKRSHLV